MDEPIYRIERGSAGSDGTKINARKGTSLHLLRFESDQALSRSVVAPCLSFSSVLLPSEKSYVCGNVEHSAF